MLPVLHIDEEALRPRIERAKRRSLSLRRDDAAIVRQQLVRSRSIDHTAEVSSRLGMRRERCASCGEPVFLAEKLVVARSVYHRSCFRCARCRHQLTPGNYYETEDGQYCCEACPIDYEEPPDLPDDQPQLTIQREHTDQQQQQPPSPPPPPPPQSISVVDSSSSSSSEAAALLEAPLSDEEKQHQLLLEQDKTNAPASKDEQRADDDKFDQMLKLINDRIDELTSSAEEKETPPPLPERPPPDDDDDDEEEAESPPAARRARDSRVHSAPDVVAHSRTTAASSLQHSNSNSTEKQSARSSSLDRLRQPNVPEHTKDQPLSQRQQHKRRLFDQEPVEATTTTIDKPEQQTQQKQEEEQEQTNDYPDDLNPFASDEETDDKPLSTNPFGSDDEEEQQLPPKPMARTKSKRRILEAPQINLNPFWSDDEGHESETELLRDKSPPVPRPRTLRHSQHADGTATLPQPKSNLAISSIHSSNTSIASSCSTLTPGGTYRKKKPAPPPPPPTYLDGNSVSPRLTPRTRKTKPAPPPPPPSATTTPERYSTSVLPVSEAELTRLREPATTADNDKLSKDEANRNTRSLSCSENAPPPPPPPPAYPAAGQLDKSLEGKWKRKKGPAPARPMPLRRKIKVMSMKDVKLELDQIEMQQQGLERQGVRLEQIIRDKCESGTASEETSLGLDVEELVLELFALVNEKNELFRRQAELMLLRRQQRLEEEHADIEYQVRCLITQPEATKTDFDKQREETLIQRLVEIVERRNEIVECLEMDRRREIEEDRSIHREMDLYAARNKAENVNMTDESRRSTLKLKKGKVKEKVKEKKSKKSSKKDADKDVDETEAKLKRHTLRKWF